MIRPNSTSLARFTLASCMALLAACADGSPTSAHVDPVDETQTIRVRVNTELALLQISGPGRVHSSSKHGTQPVVRPMRLASISTGHTGPADEPRTIVKHFRHTDGKTLSLAWYFRKGSTLPTLIYAFENGRIQAVVGLGYTRHGNGYLRSKVRVTTFDSTGTPLGQINVRSEPTSAFVASNTPREIVAAMQGIAADVLSIVLPKQLHAEESGACASEYLSYLAASAKLAAATAALQIAAAGCVIGPGTQPAACAAAGPLFIAWLEMLDKWNLALDNLLACTEAAKADEDRTSPTGSSSGGDESSGFDDPFGDIETTKKTVEQFISDSIAAGTFTCSSDGNICTYYAE